MDGEKYYKELRSKRKFYYYPPVDEDHEPLKMSHAYYKIGAKHYIYLHSPNRRKRYIRYFLHWCWMVMTSFRANTPKTHLFLGPITNRKERKRVKEAHKINMDQYDGK